MPGTMAQRRSKEATTIKTVKAKSEKPLDAYSNPTATVPSPPRSPVTPSQVG